MIQSLDQEIQNGHILKKTDQVMACVLDWIKAGKLAVGAKLPTEKDLARQFGVSLQTVNKAMARLEDLGHLHRSAGRGTHVAHATLGESIAVACDLRYLSNPEHPPFYDSLIATLLTSARGAQTIPHFLVGIGEDAQAFTRSLGLESAAWSDFKGVLLIGWREGIEELFAARGIPVVTIGSAAPGRHAVTFDYVEFGRLAARRLAELKPRRTLFLFNDDPANGDWNSPVLGFQAELATCKFDPQSVTYHGCAPTKREAKALAVRLGPEWAAAELVISADDNITGGIAEYLGEGGAQISTSRRFITHHNSATRLPVPAGSELLSYDTEAICAAALGLLRELFSGRPADAQRIIRWVKPTWGAGHG